ncbi:MAG: caspase family protein [Vicinamibacterales bacterium]
MAEPDDTRAAASSEVRRALLIGIDDYATFPKLDACVSDVQRLRPLLERHADGRPNFVVETLESGGEVLTEARLTQALRQFFATPADVLLLYFAGHGAYDEFEKAGYLVAQDGVKDDYGIGMERLIGYANRAKARHRVIVLDCCHADAVDNSFATGGLVSLADGVVVLAATRDEEEAIEAEAGGVFTTLLAAALDGAAADPVTGAVSVANVHGYIDAALGGGEQSPTFKANVARWCVVRLTEPVVPRETVLRLTSYFERPDDELPLGMEPPAPGDTPDEAAADVQALREAGLIKPVGHEHEYSAALGRGACLTPLGRYYWKRVQEARF